MDPIASYDVGEALSEGSVDVFHFRLLVLPVIPRRPSSDAALIILLVVVVISVVILRWLFGWT
jgi:hypothetical protein